MGEENISLEAMLLGGGVFVYFADKAIGFLKNRGIDLQLMSKQVTELHGQSAGINKTAKQTKDLWDWHNVIDEDGRKVWYRGRTLEEKMASLTASIEKLADVVASSHEAEVHILAKQGSILSALGRIETDIRKD